MDSRHFDDLTKTMAAGVTRRGLAKTFAAGLLGGILPSKRALAGPGQGGKGGGAKGRCPDGFVNCRGDCVVLAEDPNNCGGCRVVCPPGRSCHEGQCVADCAALGQRDCGGGVCVPAEGCCPGETRGCYTGPAGTEGVGICRGGTQTCQGDGSFGPCEGEVLPQPEACNGLDDDCDGVVDEGCGCADEGLPCNTGEAGVCATGVIQCLGGSSVCVRITQPSAEVCNGLDDDCDGVVDEGVLCPGIEDGEFCQRDRFGTIRCCFAPGLPAPISGISRDCDRCCSRDCDLFGRCE